MGLGVDSPPSRVWTDTKGGLISEGPGLQPVRPEPNLVLTLTSQNWARTGPAGQPHREQVDSPGPSRIQQSGDDPSRMAAFPNLLLQEQVLMGHALLHLHRPSNHRQCWFLAGCASYPVHTRAPEERAQELNSVHVVAVCRGTWSGSIWFGPVFGNSSLLSWLLEVHTLPFVDLSSSLTSLTPMKTIQPLSSSTYHWP